MYDASADLLQIKLSADLPYARLTRRRDWYFVMFMQLFAGATALVSPFAHNQILAVQVAGICCEFVAICAVVRIWRREGKEWVISPARVYEIQNNKTISSLALDEMDRIYWSHSCLIFCAANARICIPWKEYLSAAQRIEYSKLLVDRLSLDFEVAPLSPSLQFPFGKVLFLMLGLCAIQWIAAAIGGVSALLIANVAILTIVSIRLPRHRSSRNLWHVRRMK